jgi:hypothetical protein
MNSKNTYIWKQRVKDNQTGELKVVNVEVDLFHIQNEEGKSIGDIIAETVNLQRKQNKELAVLKKAFRGFVKAFKGDLGK